MRRRFLACLLLSVLILLPWSLGWAAAAGKTTASNSSSSSNTTTSVNSSNEQAVIQGYASDTPLQKGMMVRLDTKNPKKVTAVTADTLSQLFGVIVAPNDAAVALSNDGNNGQVFVSTCCHFPVLVSTQNGPIKVGDYITASAIAGIGMKVDSSQAIVLGKATSNFDGTNNVVATTKLKDSTGREFPVSIGNVPVNISISHNPLQQITEKNLPGVLSQVSQNIAGHAVGATRVYISLIVLIVAAIIAISILYSGIRSGLISLGRNPLGKKTIVAGIVRVVIAGVLIFLIGLFGVYLLLRL